MAAKHIEQLENLYAMRNSTEIKKQMDFIFLSDADRFSKNIYVSKII